jgi:uncharacterized protein (UPF0335 family)
MGEKIGENDFSELDTMKIRTVTGISLFLLGLLLLISEKSRPQGKLSEPKIPDKHDAIALVPNNNQAPSQLESPPSNSSKPLGKSAAMLNRAADSLELLIQTELTKIGFAQNDIDSAVKEMLSEYQDGDDRVDISRVVNKISDTMKLDEQKRQEFNLAMINVYIDSLQITFDQWNQCLAYRTQQSSDCLKDVAQELSRTVAAGLYGPDWSKEELSQSEAVVERFVDDAAAKCSESKEAIRVMLQLSLLNCPY